MAAMRRRALEIAAALFALAVAVGVALLYFLG